MQALSQTNITPNTGSWDLNFFKNKKVTLAAVIMGVAGVALIGLSTLSSRDASNLCFMASKWSGASLLFLSVGCFGYACAKKEHFNVFKASLRSFSKKEIREASQYLGKRMELRVDCQQGRKPERLLGVHALLMRDTQDYSRGFLWKIRLNQQEVYLFGSMHCRLASFFDSFPFVFDEKDYADTEQCMREYNMWLQKINERAQLFLATPVSTAFFQAEKIYFEMNDEDKSKFQSEQASRKSKTLSFAQTDEGWCGARYLPFGSEWLFAACALYGEKKEISLENAEMMARAAQLLAQALQKETAYREVKAEVTLETIDAWQFNNWDQFEKVISSMPESVRNGANGENNERNKNFADKILQILQQKNSMPPFVVIGAGHFVGPDGILKLLEKKGVQIEFIPLDEGMSTSVEEVLSKNLK